MTPREFLKGYRYDERLVTGAFYPSEPLQLETADRVGVVLFNLGGPQRPEEIEPFLYNLFMDPVIIDIPVPKVFRHRLCRFVARRRSQSVKEEYGLIGGASPINALTECQAALVEERLNAMYVDAAVDFKVYTAMRYAPPTSEEAAAQMDRDGITKVVLLPLYPQYSKTTTGASLAYWKALEEAGELRTRPTVMVFEYAAHPSYIRSISERIDEGLTRLGDACEGVHLLFSAHGTPLKELTERRDPYCCLIHSTVHQVMEYRSFAEPYGVSFQSKVGPSEWLTPSTPDALVDLAEHGTKTVLVVPVAFVSDHVETAFELDIEIRQEAEHAGIDNYEVMPGLNDHPSFIEALSDVTMRHLRMPGQRHDQPHDAVFGPRERKTACHQCPRVTEAKRWPPVSVPTQ